MKYRFYLFVILLMLPFLFAINAESPIKNANILISDQILYSLLGEWKVKLENVEKGGSLDLDDSDWKFINIPSIWALQGIHYKGIAWYRLHLNISSNLKGERLGFQVPNVLDSHKVYFNGVLIGKSGNVDPDLTKFRHNPKSDVYVIEPDLIHYDKDNVLSLQSQTFVSVGGTANETFFGPLSIVKNNFYTTTITRAAFAASFILLSIYIFLSYFGLKDISNIYSSLMLLCLSFMILTFYQIESWFIEDAFKLYYSMFTFGFGGVYLFQYLFLKAEYGYPFSKVEKVIVSLYLIVFASHFIPLIYLPFIEIRNRYLIGLLSLFHLALILQCLYYSLKALFQRKYSNYFYSIGFIIAFPPIIQDYLVVFNIKVFHDVNSIYISFILILFYTFNLILKQHSVYQKIILMEKEYSEKLENEVVKKTQELVHTNSALTESNELKNKLFSIISHDLRSPLNALNQVLYLFRNQKLTSKQLRNNIIELSETLERNQFLLENLLNWSYGQLSDTSPTIEKVNISKLLKDIYDIMLPAASKKSIELELVLDRFDYVVRFNKNALNLVLINIINNSIKFTQENGKIEFGIRLENSFLTIYVKDNGIGIAPERLEIIESEKEISPILGTNKEKGAGIGLKLCKETFRKFGIKLNISSQPNEGSLFYFVLDLNDTIVQ